MNLLYVVLQVAFCLLVPALLVRYEHRLKAVEWMSPAFWAYALGMVVGNFPGVQIDKHSAELTVGVAVLFALPLVMFSADVREWLKLAPKMLLSFSINVLATMLCSALAWYLFRDILPNAANLAAMTATVYTGNSANLAAVGIATGATQEAITQVTLSDLTWSGIYLLCIFSFAQRALWRFLPKFVPPAGFERAENAEIAIEKSLSSNEKMTAVLKGLAYAIVAGGLALGICALITGETKNSGIIVVAASLLGIAASLLRPIRTLPLTYDTGQYLLLTFCVAIGLQANIYTLLAQSPLVLVFVLVVIAGTISLHLLVAALLRIDADTVIITSVAGICSPPFIGSVANSLHNRHIAMSGMTVGVIGIALANFVGLLEFWLLK